MDEEQRSERRVVERRERDPGDDDRGDDSPGGGIAPVWAAKAIAAQTARGAASLLLQTGTHPEDEIDKVTTPRGCTIAGLNEMEHHGFSSALIRGITTSSRKADSLYSDPDS